MSTPTSAELSLINDAEFLEELGQFDPSSAQAAGPSPESRPVYRDAFDALESGLAVDAAARQGDEPPQEREPLANPYDQPMAPLAREERQVPFVAAALVIVACLAAGAAAAVFVFGDRPSQVTATQPASR